MDSKQMAESSFIPKMYYFQMEQMEKRARTSTVRIISMRIVTLLQRIRYCSAVPDMQVLPEPLSYGQEITSQPMMS